MNPSNNNFSLNDLIYLYLDGEANDVEKSALFKGLANDISLQNEFQDALMLKNHSFTSKDLIAPPLLVTNNLMNTLGVSASAAVGSAALVSGGKWLSFLNSTFSKVLLSGLVGFLLATSYFMLNDSNFDDNLNKTEIQNSDRGDFISENLLNSNFKSIIRDTVYLTNYINYDKSSSIDKSILDLSTDSSSMINLDEFPDFNFKKIDESGINEYEVSFNRVAQEFTAIPIKNVNSDLFNFDIGNELNKLSLELSGLYTLGLYPVRDEFNINEKLNNLQASIYYDITNTGKLGISFGKETFPIWVKDDNGELSARNSVTWYGLSFRQLFDTYISRFGIFPYVQVTTAATVNGPFVKSSAGLGWMPDQRVTFYFGLDYSALLQRYNNNYELNRKSGFIYNVNINF